MRHLEPATWLADEAAKVLLIEAGAGWGKSRFCADLVRHLRALGRAVLMLDGAALSPEDVLARVRALGESRRDASAICLIDDYDGVASTELEKLIISLACQGERKQFVLASRSRISIPLGRLQVSGGVRRAGPAELRLGQESIAELVGIVEETGDARSIFEWSEGWPIAVEALRVVWGSGPPGGPGRDLPGLMAAAGENLGAYIRDEILGPLDEDTRILLVQTSVLEEFGCELAKSLCGLDRSWQIIESLCRDNVLQARRDGDAFSYRLHPLVRHACRAELAKRGRGEMVRLSLAAAHWHHAKGEVTRAVALAHAAGHDGLAAQWALAVDTAMFGVTRGGPELRMIMDNVSPALLRGTPRLALAQAFLAAKANLIEVAREIVRQVRSDVTPARLADDRFLARALAIAQVAISIYDGLGPDSSALPAVEELEAAGDGDEMALGVSANMRCAMAFNQSDFAKALAQYRRARHFYEREGSENGLGYIHVHAGRIHRELADPDRAREHFELARAHFGQDALGGGPSLPLVRPYLARLHHDWGNPATALPLIDLFLGEVDKGGFYCDALFAGFRTHAMQALAAGNRIEAARRLDAGVEYAGLRQIAYLHQLLLIERALIEDDVVLAFEIAERVRPDGGKGADAGTADPWQVCDLRARLSAKLALLEGEREQALAILAAQAKRCERQGRRRGRIDLMIQLALAFDQSERREEALAAMGDALRDAAPGRIMAPFIENGREAVMLLSLLLSAGASDRAEWHEHAAFIERIIRHAGELGQGSTAVLSDRENEVLQCLVQGMSNKLIARALSISPETVRYHLKGLYEKFGIRTGYANRKALVQFVSCADVLRH